VRPRRRLSSALRRGHNKELLEFVDEAATELGLRRVGGLECVPARGLIQVGAILREEPETFVTTPGSKSCGSGRITWQGRQGSLQHRYVHDSSTGVDTVHEVAANAAAF